MCFQCPVAVPQLQSLLVSLLLVLGPACRPSADPRFEEKSRLDEEATSGLAVAHSPDEHGIGVVFKPKVYELEVYRVRAGSDARESGLRRGDRVVAVDGQPIREIGHRRALRRMRGAAETAIELEVRLVGAKSTQLIRVQRRRGQVDVLR